MSNADFHMHSTFSPDSSAGMDDLCRMALERGLKSICFTEHVDFDPADDCYGFFNYERYKESVAAARERYRDKLVIGFGAEVSYGTDFVDEIRRFLVTHDLDYVLGSVHMIEHIFVGDPIYFEGKTEKQAYSLYWDEMLASAKSGFFTRIGHFDYLKQARPRDWGEFSFAEWRDRIAEVLTEIIGSGATIEVNTSAIRKGLGEPFPSWDILKLYKDLGGEGVTMGSDSHRARDIASNFDTVGPELERMGFHVYGAEMLP